MLYAVFAIAILVALALPFLPGLRELLRPTDDKALDVDMDYVKDPFYMGTSFRNILARSLSGIDLTESGQKTLQLSKREDVLIVGDPLWEYDSPEVLERVVRASGDVRIAPESALNKEIYAMGDAEVGERTKLRALLSEGSVTLGRDSSVVRWIDGRGQIMRVGEDCTLGQSTICAGALELGAGCTFTRLYGAPVRTLYRGGFAPMLPEAYGASGSITESASIFTEKDLSVMNGAKLTGNIVAKTRLCLGDSAEVDGNIKARAEVRLGRGVVVKGNIIADGDVLIEDGCRIDGNIFSNGTVEIGRNCTVGVAGHVCSVIARNALTLAGGVTINGFVACERGGSVGK